MIQKPILAWTWAKPYLVVSEELPGSPHLEAWLVQLDPIRRSQLPRHRAASGQWGGFGWRCSLCASSEGLCPECASSAQNAHQPPSIEASDRRVTGGSRHVFFSRGARTGPQHEQGAAGRPRRVGISASHPAP